MIAHELKAQIYREGEGAEAFGMVIDKAADLAEELGSVTDAIDLASKRGMSDLVAGSIHFGTRISQLYSAVENVHDQLIDLKAAIDADPVLRKSVLDLFDKGINESVAIRDALDVSVGEAA